MKHHHIFSCYFLVLAFYKQSLLLSFWADTSLWGQQNAQMLLKHSRWDIQLFHKNTIRNQGKVLCKKQKKILTLKTKTGSCQRLEPLLMFVNYLQLRPPARTHALAPTSLTTFSLLFSSCHANFTRENA